MTKESASKLFDRLKWVIALAIFGAAVVGNSYFSDIAFLYRVLGVVFLFIIGLVLGPIFYAFFAKIDIPFLITSSLPIIIAAGFLVGIGTKIGRGCTSGHGICGISLLSVRSIIATIIFMITAIITVKLIG